MSKLDDVLGSLNKTERAVEEDRIPVAGMCEYQIALGESCYFPYDYGIYDSVNKRMTIVCIKGHETVIAWEMLDG